MSGMPRGNALGGVSVRPMQEADLPGATEIVRLAFGTFVGAPDPSAFWLDRDYVFTRGFRTDFQGVTMHRPDSPGYNRPTRISDWR